jgi:hypothetical protein
MRCLGNFIPPKGSSFPTATEDGELFYNTTAGIEGLYAYEAGSAQWIFQGSGRVVPFFRATRTSAQTLTSLVTDILFDSESPVSSGLADPNGWYDPATGKWQPRRAGWYQVGATVP